MHIVSVLTFIFYLACFLFLIIIPIYFCKEFKNISYDLITNISRNIFLFQFLLSILAFNLVVILLRIYLFCSVLCTSVLSLEFINIQCASTFDAKWFIKMSIFSHKYYVLRIVDFGRKLIGLQPFRLIHILCIDY